MCILNNLSLSFESITTLLHSPLNESDLLRLIFQIILCTILYNTLPLELKPPDPTEFFPLRSLS